MSRQVQYQERSDAFPPIAAPAGFETITPDTTRRRQVTDAGGHVDTFRPLTQPTPPGSGFEGIAPDTARRRKNDAGWSVDVFAPPAAAAHAPGSGFESIAPDTAKRRTTQTTGSIESFSPTVTPFGFESIAPDRSLRRDPAQVFIPETPAPFVPAPWGFDTTSPERSSRRTPPVNYLADIYFVQPPVVLVPLGFESIAPDTAKRRSIDAGWYAEALLALTQPVAPGSGWESIAPERALRRLAPALFDAGGVLFQPLPYIFAPYHPVVQLPVDADGVAVNRPVTFSFLANPIINAGDTILSFPAPDISQYAPGELPRLTLTLRAVVSPKVGIQMSVTDGQVGSTYWIACRAQTAQGNTFIQYVQVILTQSTAS